MATHHDRKLMGLCNQLHESVDEVPDDDFLDVELGDEITIEIDGEEYTGRVGWFMDGGFALLSHELPQLLTTHEIIDLEGAPFVVAQILDGAIVVLITDDEDAFDGGYWIAGEPWEYEQDAPMDEDVDVDDGVEEARRVRVRYSRTNSGGYRRTRTKRTSPSERRKAKKYYKRHKAQIKRKLKRKKKTAHYKRMQKKLQQKKKGKK